MYAPVAGAKQTLFDLMPNALVFADEPAAMRTAQDKWWDKVKAMHERSGVGKLVQPEDIFLNPEKWWQALAKLPGAELEHLGRLLRADQQASSAATGPV